MGQSNLAKKIYNNSNKINEPAHLQDIKFKLSLSKFEKTIILTGSTILFGMMIGLVGEKISLSNNATSLQMTTNALNRVENNNGTLKQEASELQSGNRLQRIAKEAGLSLTNKNVRNVSE